MKKTTWPDMGSIYSMSKERACHCLVVQMAHRRDEWFGLLTFPLHILCLQMKGKGWKSVFAELLQGDGGWEGTAGFLQVSLATSQFLQAYLTSLVLPF